MVLDLFENIDLYAGMHPSFPKVFNYLKNLDLNDIQTGKIVVDDDFYINVDEVALRPSNMANLEAHNAYIDIQIPISNFEYVGYKPTRKCKMLKEMHPKQDITFYKDKFDFSFVLPVGSFAIFFPQDAHAPIVGNGKTKKIVVKVKAK